MFNKVKAKGFFAVVQSILAAGIGVQSQSNQERDFRAGKPLHFIVGGVIGTVMKLDSILNA